MAIINISSEIDTEQLLAISEYCSSIEQLPSEFTDTRKFRVQGKGLPVGDTEVV